MAVPQCWSYWVVWTFVHPVFIICWDFCWDQFNTRMWTQQNLQRVFRAEESQARGRELPQRSTARGKPVKVKVKARGRPGWVGKEMKIWNLCTIILSKLFKCMFSHRRFSLSILWRERTLTVKSSKQRAQKSNQNIRKNFDRQVSIWVELPRCLDHFFLDVLVADKAEQRSWKEQRLDLWHFTRVEFCDILQEWTVT